MKMALFYAELQFVVVVVVVVLFHFLLEVIQLYILVFFLEWCPDLSAASDELSSTKQDTDLVLDKEHKSETEVLPEILSP